MVNDGGCYTCTQEAGFPNLPDRELIAHDAHWRAAHAVATPLAGWLVLLPRRHVTAIAELSDAEAAALGAWQVRLSEALHVVTGCRWTYLAQFMEAPGYRHVHFHLVPRAADQPEELRGPGVFELLRRPVSEHLAPEQADVVARKVRAALRGWPGGR